jgi:hypothetical protein
MRALINLLTLLLIIFVLVFFQLFLVLAVMSMFIVPATWVYAQLNSQSYSFTIDQSNMLYKLNILGQWSLVIGGSIMFLCLLFI